MGTTHNNDGTVHIDFTIIFYCYGDTVQYYVCVLTLLVLGWDASSVCVLHCFILPMFSKENWLRDFERVFLFKHSYILNLKMVDIYLQ